MSLETGELSRYEEMHGKGSNKINNPADGTEVGDDTRKKIEEGSSNEGQSENNDAKKLLDIKRMEVSRKKGVEIAQATQAPANNSDTTEAEEIGFQQKEALSKTFP